MVIQSGPIHAWKFQSFINNKMIAQITLLLIFIIHVDLVTSDLSTQFHISYNARGITPEISCEGNLNIFDCARKCHQLSDCEGASFEKVL